MGLFSKIGSTQTYGDVPFMGEGQHRLCVVRCEQGKTRGGHGMFVAVFEVLESKCVNPDGTEVAVHAVGSKVKILPTSKYEIDLFLKNTKDVVQAAAGSLLAESPHEIAHFSGDDVDEAFMLEVCWGPFEYDDDGEIMLGGDTLGNADADETARALYAGIPKRVKGAQPGTTLAGAVVSATVWKKPGKTYTVKSFSALPLSEHPDFVEPSE
jgi:hypothetical protein